VQASLRILMLEDIPEEAEIVQRELRKSGLTFEARQVQTRREFAEALENFAPDLILADSKLPAFDGRSALDLANQRSPRIPVIIVTGELGDEAAVELLLAGASDYVLKDRLARLGSAVRRVLQAEEDRRNRERLENALRNATEEERRRLAKDLHDGLGQELTGLAILAEGLVMQAARSDSPVPPELERLADIARHAIRTCREIAHGMSPFGGSRGGLPEALRELTVRLCGPPGPRVSLSLGLDAPLVLPRPASEHLFRIAQEALANAIKHSGADNVQVSLEVTPCAVGLRVLDDGAGPELEPSGSSGLGLRTMHDRAEAIGARLTVGARPDGRGTVVFCEAPQNQPPAARLTPR
jgi:two-component system, NarL family, sensor histidine kinase UhpB